MTAKHLSFTRMLKNFRKFFKQNGSWLGSGSARKYDSSARLDQVLARARLGSKKISDFWLVARLERH